jgi:hypothetical protein
MPKHKEPTRTPEQSKLFIEKAREIGADEETDVTEVMRRLASQKRAASAKKVKK